MSALRYTLLSEGTSDQALLPVLDWLLRHHFPDHAVQPSWANPQRFGQPPKRLSDKIALTIEFFPCDVLFVHRDADRELRENRVREITGAKLEVKTAQNLPVVCVVPTRMTEAWLLHDEAALRTAAGNPHGKEPLQLPRIADLEKEPDPKDLLHKLLLDASGRKGRRLRSFAVSGRVRRLAELIDDFAPLRALPAFRSLESDIQNIALF